MTTVKQECSVTNHQQQPRLLRVTAQTPVSLLGLLPGPLELSGVIAFFS